MRIRIWILNLLLLAMAAGLVWKLKTDWHTYAAANGPQALVLRPLGSVVAPPLSPQSEYSAIAQQNAFHPDRNDSMPPPPAVQVTTAPPPLVYGSLILGDNRYALMAPDESAVPQQIQEGQSLNGYTLVRVQAQSVTLESSSGQQEIMFYNAMSKLRRNSSKTVAASNGAAGGAVHTGSASSQSAAANAAASTSAAAPQPAAAPAAAPPPGKKVVQTPFGPMLMDDKPAQPVIKQ